jgi:hypothetical protein
MTPETEAGEQFELSMPVAGSTVMGVKQARAGEAGRYLGRLQERWV